MLVFLVGYMGSGKTLIGRLLAERLNYRFLDMDEMIEIATGYSIPAFFEKFGEHAFRVKERDILLNHLGEVDCVIATGGGTPCFENNMELINQSGVSVYVDTSVDVILNRLERKSRERPLLSRIARENLPGFISEHMKSRMVYYEKALLRVSGEDPDLGELTRALMDRA